MIVEKLCNTNDNIDQAILEAEVEVSNGAIPVDADIVFEELEKKYFK